MSRAGRCRSRGRHRPAARATAPAWAAGAVAVVCALSVLIGATALAVGNHIGYLLAAAVAALSFGIGALIDPRGRDDQPPPATEDGPQ